FISFSNYVAKGHRLHFGNLLREDVVTVQSARRSTLTLFPFTSALCLRYVAILLLRCIYTYYVINARRWDGIEVYGFH
ncbi:unnamed protein product, partial [Brassica oleracea var. botrytis]